MKQLLHKIVSLIMVLFLLLSTISWKVEKHYCMGRLMDVALFTNADSCGMDMSMSVLENSEAISKTKNSCCDDEVVFVEGQDDLKISFNELDLEHQYFLTAFSYAYTGLFQRFEEKSIPHEQYPPPILVKDIQLLDEAFLI